MASCTRFKVRSATIPVLLALLWTIGVEAQAQAQARSAPEVLGAAIARRDCSQCHAVGLRGESPNSAAPAFRKLERRFVVRELDPNVLAELMSHHAGMPRFRLSLTEREGLIAYLKALQTYKQALASDPARG